MPPTQSQSRDKIGQLIAKYQKMPREDRVRISEAGVVHQFLDPLLEALGWPIQDPQHYKYELFTQGGRPDMTLIPDRAARSLSRPSASAPSRTSSLPARRMPAS